MSKYNISKLIAKKILGILQKASFVGVATEVADIDAFRLAWCISL